MLPYVVGRNLNMGTTYTKQEEKEVLINQNAAGSNDARITEHTYVNNILMSTFLAVIALVVIGVLYKIVKKNHEKWIRKEIRKEVWSRLQARMSFRKATATKEGEEEV